MKKLVISGVAVLALAGCGEPRAEQAIKQCRAEGGQVQSFDDDQVVCARPGGGQFPAQVDDDE